MGIQGKCLSLALRKLSGKVKRRRRKCWRGINLGKRIICHRILPVRRVSLFDVFLHLFIIFTTIT